MPGAARRIFCPPALPATFHENSAAYPWSEFAVRGVSPRRPRLLIIELTASSPRGEDVPSPPAPETKAAIANWYNVAPTWREIANLFLLELIKRARRRQAPAPAHRVHR